MTNIRNTNPNIMAQELLARGLMTSDEIIARLKEDPNGKTLPFKTFDEWKRDGYYVKKGEKAVFKTRLWKALSRKNDEGKWELVKKEDGSQAYVKPYCHIFSKEQVIAKDELAKANAEKVESKKEVKKEKASELPPHRDGVVVVKYEKKAKKNSKKATRKTTTKVVETKKSEPKKATPKKATKKLATKKTTKAPTMIRKDFVKNGLKMVQFVASDNKMGFTMPLANYENMTNKKRFDKMWGIA